MDIRRFGPGHRRADGPAGTQGVEGAVIHHDEKALVSELAFGRFSMVAPHSNPNTALFIIISGGGYVQVGDERTRVNHGEAVLWPADVPHGAYTDGSEMRAIVIEIPAGEGAVLAGEAATILAARARPASAADEPSKKPVEGKLAERQKLRADYDSSEGEPW
jgi:quercetin dioxygenase-like cupin family protein